LGGGGLGQSYSVGDIFGIALKISSCAPSHSLPNWHVIDIEIEGPTDPETGHTFTVRTTRHNPAALAVVTGSATYSSFLSSLLSKTRFGVDLQVKPVKVKHSDETYLSNEDLNSELFVSKSLKKANDNMLGW